jgi:hypothetical protein
MLRREIYQKKSEKESGKLVENMLWGVPIGRECSLARFDCG